MMSYKQRTDYFNLLNRFIIMKKLFAISVAVMLAMGAIVSVASVRSNDDNAQPRQERAKMTPGEKAQILTDRMAKAYDLNDEQKARLLELNKKTLAPRQRQMGQPAEKPCAAEGEKSDSAKCNKPCPQAGKAAGNAQRGKFHGQRGRGFNKGARYMKALKEIMTEEQFKAYCIDKRIERSIYGQNNKADFRGQRGGQPRFQGRARYGHGPMMRRPHAMMYGPRPVAHVKHHKRNACMNCAEANGKMQGCEMNDGKACKKSKQCKEKKADKCCKESKQCKSAGKDKK